MLLHRYLRSHTYETLKEAKLMASRITSFNDPFEFLFITKGALTAKLAREYVMSRLHDPDFPLLVASHIPGLLESKNPQKVLEANASLLIASVVSNAEKTADIPLKVREEMADRSTRVICFSDGNIEPLDEILLWSHYADHHKGIRIGFEFPDGLKYPFKIAKVVYQDKRFVIDYAKGLTKGKLGNALVESAKVKSTAWKYEREYRLLTHPDVCERRTMPDSTIQCFLDFKREWVKSIDFGVRCPKTEMIRVLDVVKKEYSTAIVCRKAVFHKSEYALEYEIVS